MILRIVLGINVSKNDSAIVIIQKRLGQRIKIVCRDSDGFDIFDFVVGLSLV